MPVHRFSILPDRDAPDAVKIAVVLYWIVLVAIALSAAFEPVVRPEGIDFGTWIALFSGTSVVTYGLEIYILLRLAAGIRWAWIGTMLMSMFWLGLLLVEALWHAFGTVPAVMGSIGVTVQAIAACLLLTRRSRAWYRLKT